VSVANIFARYACAQAEFLHQQGRGRPFPVNQETGTCDMSNESNLPSAPAADDGFGGVDIDSTRIIQGTILRCTDGVWTDGDGVELPPDTKLVALSTTMCLQRWKDQMPAETIRKVGNEPLPDLDELNDQIPRSEWEIGLNDEPRPPWQLQHVVYLLDPSDASVFTFISSTFGARLATERLRSKVAWMRQLRNNHVVPLIKLDSKPMKTKFGKKQRPEFTILEWRQLGHVGVPDASSARLEHKPDDLAGLQPVKPVTFDEDIADEIPNLS
jgi:hypothetical protein